MRPEEPAGIFPPIRMEIPVAKIFILSDLDTAEYLSRCFGDADVTIICCSLDDMESSFREQPQADVIITTTRLESADGRRLRVLADEIPIVVISTREDAARNLQAGAYECVTESRDRLSVLAAVRRAIELSLLSQELKQLRTTQATQGPDITFSRGTSPSELPTLDTLERRYVRQVLQATRGNKTWAARVLGVDRRTLYRKLDRWDQR